MSTTRQIIGKRRKVSAVQSRGVARREALIKAAIDLLETEDPQDISFRQIAQKADVPEGSAYHFYANKYDLFAAVASEMSQIFLKAQSKSIKRKPIKTWHDIVDVLIERGAEIYRQNTVARVLLIGSTVPPEIKQVDQDNNLEIADVMKDRFEEYFALPDIPSFERKLFYFIEMTDLLFSINLRETGSIQDDIIEEAKRVGKGYLSTYLPAVLTPKSKDV